MFFDIVDDLDLFKFGDFNLFNLFYTRFSIQDFDMEGYKNKASLGIYLRYIKSFFYIFSFLFKAIAIKLSKTRKQRILFMGSSGRYSTVEGQVYNLYNGQIIEQKGVDDFIVAQRFRDGVSDRYQAEFYLIEDLLILWIMIKLIFSLIFWRRLQDYANRITKTYPQLNMSKSRVKSLVSTFYALYYSSRLFLWFIEPREVFLICHYGKEYLTAACKDRNLKVTELMHGRIDQAHPNYNYPVHVRGFLKSSLFPDRLAVYGDFWKDQVLRGNLFSEDQIIVIGYYLKTADVRREPIPRSNRQTILITTQWPVARNLYDYISFLKGKLNKERYEVIIKPHSGDDPTYYDDLIDPGFINITNDDVYHLLNRVSVHISAASTVLYEAIRYNIPNYVLVVDQFRIESQAIIESGVAYPLDKTQVPDFGLTPNISTEYFFAEYDPAILFNTEKTYE
jgi:hypothetical protein